MSRKLTVADRAERRLRPLLNKWVKLLGLERWSLNIELAPETSPVDEDLESEAECWAHWQYEQATIRFNEKRVMEMTDRQLADTVIHELLHCVLAEMREKKGQEKHEERTTVNLTRAFLRVAA